MIENLEDELYQLENKKAKDAKPGATPLCIIIVEWSECKYWEKTPQVHLIIIKK